MAETKKQPDFQKKLEEAKKRVVLAAELYQMRQRLDLSARETAIMLGIKSADYADIEKADFEPPQPKEPETWEGRFDEKYKIGENIYSFDTVNSINDADVKELKLFIQAAHTEAKTSGWNEAIQVLLMNLPKNKIDDFAARPETMPIPFVKVMPFAIEKNRCESFNECLEKVRSLLESMKKPI